MRLLLESKYVLEDIDDAFALATGGMAIGKVQITMPE